VPVFEQRIDNIVGIAYAMDLLDFLQKVKSVKIFYDQCASTCMFEELPLTGALRFK